MNKLLLLLFTLCLSSMTGVVNAEDKGKHTGDGASEEHMSEQGAEHGKAYAGSKEKKEKDSDDEDDMKKAKKDSKEKKEKKSKKEK